MPPFPWWNPCAYVAASTFICSHDNAATASGESGNATGSSTASGFGIRWPENGRRPQRSGFKTRREARGWFAENVAPRLGSGLPSSEISFDEFCALYLERHGASVSARTKPTISERLAPARAQFGSWPLRDLEGAADDVAQWRACLSASSRYRLTNRVAPGAWGRGSLALLGPESSG